jgi:dephospho-CoA kinase
MPRAGVEGFLKILMLRVGLTGSIAVGKSHAVGVLRELGCHVIDADQTARDVVAPGTEGLRRVREEFGEEVLQTDGTLDRAQLGTIIFADREKRERLNAILHPLIIKEQDELLRRWEAEDPHGIGIIDAALMIESGGYRRFDKVVVVHCRPEIQLERLMRRNNLSREEAERRIGAQMPQEEKMRYADFLIDTSEDYETTRARIIEVFQKLEELSEAKTRQA